MLSTGIKPGDKLQFKAKDGYNSRNLYLTRVGDVIDQKNLLVYTPIAEGSFVNLPLGEEYTFLFYTENGLLEATGTILENFLLNGVGFIKIEVAKFERIQRRFFYRLNCIINFTFIRVSDQQDDIEENEKNNIPVYKAVTKDISGGGIRFVSDIVLTLNEHIIIQFSLNGKNTITIEGAIRSKDHFGNLGDRCEYRIEFINIRRGLQEQIVQHIFYLQQQLIKKTMPDFEQRKNRI